MNTGSRSAAAIVILLLCQMLTGCSGLGPGNPSASIAADTDSINVGETVNFDARDSTSPEPTIIDEYRWNFGDGETKTLCPHVSGGRGWLPTAFDPASTVVYVPIVEACMDLVPVPEGERGNLTTGVRWTVRPRPESDGQYGRLEAVNLATGETAWVARQRAPQTTGALATAGGLVFAGSLDRRISAYDASTGDRLWATRLSEIPNAPPITFSVDGRQYVAVIVGAGGYVTRAYQVLAPEIENPPDRGASLWVFALPPANGGVYD